MTDQVMQIAMRVRELREAVEWTCAQAAQATGVGEEEYISYESGQVDIPISFLLKLSQVYGVDTTTILTGEAPRLSVCAVTRKNMGVDVVRAHHYVYKNLAYNFSNRKVEPLLVSVAPGVNANMETNSHTGHEFDYVLEGTMLLRVGGQDIVLQPGDSAYYDSIHPHAMQSLNGETVKFLAIVIPVD